MLTRDQFYTMLMLRKREGTIFSDLPEEMFQHIIGVNNFSQDANSEIAKALHHAAFAQEDNIKILIAMLEANPQLLLTAGNVITRGGLDVRRVTPYEFALGAGDADLAKRIEPYFAEIENGENERLRQYERYRPHIERILTPPDYDLSNLIKIIKNSSPEEVMAALNKESNATSKLGNALVEFRNHVRPGIVIKPRMHYNYQMLICAYDCFYREWDSLQNGNNYHKANLVWRQVIGYLQRGLPALERFAMARNQFYAWSMDTDAYIETDVERTVEFKSVRDSFPNISSGATELTGLGFDYGAYGDGFTGQVYWKSAPLRGFKGLQDLCKAKMSALQKLANRDQKRQCDMDENRRSKRLRIMQ